MKINITETYCFVEREDGDPKFYGVAKGESNFLHALKNKLNAMGFDLIKKRMHKDGHLVDDMQFYIRSRKFSKGGFCIYSTFWSIRGANEDFNNGHVTLRVEPLLANDSPCIQM